MKNQLGLKQVIQNRNSEDFSTISEIYLQIRDIYFRGIITFSLLKIGGFLINPDQIVTVHHIVLHLII